MSLSNREPINVGSGFRIQLMANEGILYRPFPIVSFRIGAHVRGVLWYGVKVDQIIEPPRRTRMIATNWAWVIPKEATGLTRQISTVKRASPAKIK